MCIVQGTAGRSEQVLIICSKVVKTALVWEVYVNSGANQAGKPVHRAYFAP